MPVAARVGIDKILTGHLCSMTAGIAGPGAVGNFGTVVIAGGIAACAQDVIAPHTIRRNKACVPHGARVNTGSPRVIGAGRPLARIGDSADAGAVITGTFRVFIGS